MRVEKDYDNLFSYEEDNVKAAVCRVADSLNVYLNRDAMLEFLLELRGLASTYQMHDDISIVTSWKITEGQCDPVAVLDIFVVPIEYAVDPDFSRSESTSIQQGERIRLFHTRPELTANYFKLRRMYDRGGPNPTEAFNGVVISCVPDSFFSEEVTDT